MAADRSEGSGSEVLDELFRSSGRDHAAVVRLVCAGYCEYFKGEGGEPECGGFAAVIGALAEGAITREQLLTVVDVPPPEPKSLQLLTDQLCSACGYLVDGCDYMSQDPPPGATPCGGYRLLQALMDQRALDGEQLLALLRLARS